MTDVLDAWLVDYGTFLAGRSAAWDGLVALPMRNDLVKAAVVCGCFVAAWHAARSPRQVVRQRSMLLLALISSLAALAVSVGLSSKFVAPRPYVFAQRVYRLEEGQLAAQPMRAIRSPRDGGSRERLARLEKLDLPPNDFGSFPSDHASLFVPLAMGVWLASRRIGLLALAWTVLFILYPKLHLGLHGIRDLAAGAALGLGALSIAMGITGLLPPLERWLRRISLASERYRAAASGLLFVAMVEICSKFEHIEALLASAKKFL